MAFIYHCLESTTMLQKLCEIHFVNFRLENYLPDNFCVTRGDEWQLHVGIISYQNKKILKKSSAMWYGKKKSFKNIQNFLQTQCFSWSLEDVFQHCPSNTKNAKPSTIDQCLRKRKSNWWVFSPPKLSSMWKNKQADFRISWHFLLIASF